MWYTVWRNPDGRYETLLSSNSKEECVAERNKLPHDMQRWTIITQVKY